MLTNLDSASYDQILAYLFTLKGSYGLSSVLELASLLGNPQNTFKSVHVGGSNGKGSVSTKMAKALELEGLKCGLYTSPHIDCYRERIQINGEKIPEKEALRLLRHLLRYNIAKSFFEVTTLLAFCWFAEQGVDFAVIEVGLGGRLDATNIITPKLAIVTSISLEHTEILGSTLEAIAKEKAGIFKPGVRGLLGPRVEFIPGVEQIEGLFNTYDEENSLVARRGLEILEVSQSSIEIGIQVRPPCRLEWINPKTVLDVAHNPDGIGQLLKCIGDQKAHFLIAFSKNKDARQALELIHKKALSFIFTKSTHHPSISPQELHDITRKLGFKGPIYLEQDPSFATELVKQIQQNDLVVVTGTFYIMKEVKNTFS